MKGAPRWERPLLLHDIVTVILQEPAVFRQADFREFDGGVPLSPSPEPSVMIL